MRFLIFLTLIFTSVFLYSQESSAKQMASQAQQEGGKDGLSQQVLGEIGFSKIEGDSYMKISFGYEFTLGKMGLGVQIPLNFLVDCNDDDGCDDKTWNKIRKDDWNNFTDWLTLVRYFRYGHKFDESNYIYGRFGDLGSSYIGHATIVSNYLNSVSWSEFKPGLQFDVYTPWGGIETIFDDITSMGLMGTRLYVRPLSFIFDKDSYLANFAIGTSFIGDRKANTLNTKTEKVEETGLMFYAFDLEFKIFRNKYVTITPYTDFNFVSDFGHGFHFGIDTKLHIPLTGAYFKFKPEYRVLGDEYMPTYFNAMYMVENQFNKYDTLKEQKAKNGYYIELGYDQYLLEALLFTIKGTYEDYEGSNNSSVLLFASVPILDSYKLSAIYSKVMFDEISEAFNFKDALLIIEGSVGVYGPLNLRIQYERTWYENEDGDLEYESSWNFGVFAAFTF